MRITCPNCGAQYEVDDALIPESGRDVQCSSCGKGWFQTREASPEPVPAVTRDSRSEPDDDWDDVDPADAEAPPETEADWPDEADTAARADADPEPVEAEPAVEDAAEDAAAEAPAPRADDDHQPEPEEEPEAPPPAEAALPPRTTDESILAILREEAEREIAQRRQEAATLESQPELGLPEAPARGAAPKPVDAAAVGGTRQREILPDIDAINSSLRSDRDRADALDDEALVEEQRRGFRMGFGIMIAVAALLIGLYVGAGWLAETVPALAPALAAYLDLANSLRSWIDGLLAAGVDGLSALLPPPEGA